ncbi:DUF3303 family protein [Chloroflexota bacterium]
MAKYFITWEADESLWPTGSKEHSALRSKLADMVKQDMKEGKMNDWGVFVGGDKGYSIAEGNAVDLYKHLQRYHPYINFMVHQVLSIDELLEVAKSLME